MPTSPEANIKSILEWLALAHGRTGAEDADQLHHQLLLLRETPAPNTQRLKILDLLFSQAERIAKAEALDCMKSACRFREKSGKESGRCSTCSRP